MPQLTVQIDEETYQKLQRISQETLSRIISKTIKQEIAPEEDDIDWDWEGVTVFADEKLLAKAWLSPEDEKAFAYLQ
ncbi:MAG: orotate phosphoribosyltransferase-like protein [Patescibacteria group bacterium]|jgi:orotate phosphoribosyltransferase-like protein